MYSILSRNFRTATRPSHWLAGIFPTSFKQLHISSAFFSSLSPSSSVSSPSSANLHPDDFYYDSDVPSSICGEYQSSSKFNRLPRHLLRAKLNLLLRKSPNHKLSPHELKKVFQSLPFADDAELTAGILRRYVKIDDINSENFVPVLQCLGEIGDVDFATKIYSSIHTAWKKGDSRAFPFKASHLSVLMKTLQSKKKYLTGIEIYNDVLSHPEYFAAGAASDAVLCNSVIKLLTYSMPQSSIDTASVDGKISKNDVCGDMLHYAIGIFNELSKKGTMPHQSTYGLLISMAGKAGRLDVAEMILSDMTSAGIEPSVVTITSLMTAAFDNKNYTLVLNLYQKLLEKGQDLDEKTISVVLNACRANGLRSEGLKIYVDWCKNGGASSIRVCKAAFLLTNEINGLPLHSRVESPPSSQNGVSSTISDGTSRHLETAALRQIFKAIFSNPHYFRKSRTDNTFNFVSDKYIPMELICGFAGQLAIDGRTDELLSAMVLQQEFQHKIHQNLDNFKKTAATEEVNAIIWCSLFESMPKIGTWRDVMAAMERLRSHLSLWKTPNLQIDVLSSCAASLIVCGVAKNKTDEIISYWKKYQAIAPCHKIKPSLCEAVEKKITSIAPANLVQPSLSLIRNL